MSMAAQTLPRAYVDSEVLLKQALNSNYFGEILHRSLSLKSWISPWRTRKSVKSKPECTKFGVNPGLIC